MHPCFRSIEIDPVTLIPKRAIRYSHINPAFKGDLAAAVPCRDIDLKLTINYAMEYQLGGKAKYTFYAIADEDSFNPPVSSLWLYLYLIKKRRFIFLD